MAQITLNLPLPATSASSPSPLVLIPSVLILPLIFVAVSAFSLWFLSSLLFHPYKMVISCVPYGYLIVTNLGETSAVSLFLR